MRKNQSSEKRFELFATIILILMTFVALMPILLIVIASFTDEKTLLAGGYTYLPKKLSLNAYYYMLKQGALIFRSYGISLLVTVIGTVSSVLLTTMLAYPMSRRNFKYRNILAFLVFFTMLFNGGIVSSYMLWSRFLHIKNTIWALIIPNYLVTGFNIFLVRNYYANGIPDSLIESAQIDGATEIKIFGKIMFPLAVPTVATISLFTGLGYWNDWINGLYYITEPKFFGIQNLLIRIMNNIQFLKTGTIANALGTGSVELPGTAVRMAMAVIGILPIVIIYPFVQKYFIKGVVIGAVKG
jgi:putative aldouronate transport system permease protein